MWYTRTTCPLHMKWELDPEAQLPGTAILSEFALKGYSGVNLIHKTAPAPERSSFPTVNLCSFRNLRKDRAITIHCSLCLQQETAIKNPLIVRYKWGPSTVQGIKHLLALPDLYWQDNTTRHSPAAAWSLWGIPASWLPSAVEFRSSRMKMYEYYSMEMQSKFMGVYQFITIIERKRTELSISYGTW